MRRHQLRRIPVYAGILLLLLLMPPLPAFLLGTALGEGPESNSRAPFLSMTVFSSARWLSSLLVVGLIALGDKAKSLRTSHWILLCVGAVILYAVPQWIALASAQGPWEFSSWEELVDSITLVSMVDLLALHGPVAGLLCALSIWALRTQVTVSERYGASRSVR